jgi:sugar phosphate isomerase/epimerase
MTTQDAAAQHGSSIDSRLGCSTISFRAWTLPGAFPDITLTAAAEFVNAAGLELLVEAPTRGGCAPTGQRCCTRRSDAPVDAVLDLSHVVASGGNEVEAVRRFGERIGHVQLRDAVLGDINRSIGRGEVDFPATIEALAAADYRGHYSLELELTTSRTRTGPRKPAALTIDPFGGTHARIRQDRHHHRSRLQAGHRSRHRAHHGR